MQKLEEIKMENLRQEEMKNFVIRPKMLLNIDDIMMEDLLDSIKYLSNDMENMRIVLEAMGYMNADRWNLFYSLTEELNDVLKEIWED